MIALTLSFTIVASFVAILVAEALRKDLNDARMDRVRHIAHAFNKFNHYDRVWQNIVKKLHEIDGKNNENQNNIFRH